MSAPERWAAFLAQIGGRHAEVCREAEATARETLLASGFDPIPVSHAMMAVAARLKELERRIIDTWNDKVEATFEAEGFDPARLAVERRKGEDLAFELDTARETLEMRVATSGARMLHARATETQNPALAERAVSWGSHAFGQEAAYQEWLAMRNADRRARDHRSPTPLALLQDYERAQVAFWTKYFTTRARFEPVLGDVPREVRARMQFWYDVVASEQEWIRAGQPRIV